MERQESMSEAGAPAESRSETGAPRYLSNDFFCLSFSPFFGKDSFGLTSSF